MNIKLDKLFESLSINEAERREEIRAECRQMCPQEEANMRIKFKLVHSLEKKVANSRVQYTLVKEYSRPAAGKVIKSSQLRTIDTLLKTTNYLIKNVYTRDEVNYLTRYEFIFDRLRAIRQDMIIQRLNDEKSAQILETIVNFYIVADYRMCHDHQNYDEFINNQHLMEVLNLIMSNVYANRFYSVEKQAVFYSIYLLLNLDNSHVLTRIVQSAKHLKCVYPLDKVFQVCKRFVNKNYVSMWRLFRQLPLICQLAFHRKIPTLEIEMFKVMNCGYSIKNSAYPIEHLVEITLLNSRLSLEKYINAHLLAVDSVNSQYLVFSKLNNQNYEQSEQQKCKAKIKVCERESLLFLDERLNELNESDFILDSRFV